MSKKIHVCILFGGVSFEHEVALQSARNVINSIDREKYMVSLVGIDKRGKWHHYDEKDYLQNKNNPKTIALGKKRGEVNLFKEEKIDVLFPIFHGPLGEDGTIQGVCKLTNLPFVGSDVASSAICMDKDIMKRLLRDAGLKIADFLTIHQYQRHLWPLGKVLKKFSFPFFVKPANAGSSIGISKVKCESEYEKAMEIAFQYDRKILIEEAIVGRELNCSLLGNEYPTISLPCEIIPKGEFHSYASKYLDPDGAEFIIPAKLTPEELSNIHLASLKAYQCLSCEGMARVDLFLSNKGEVYINEVNTIPGLTNMSPYAKMWEVTGLSNKKMVDKLIQLALDRKEKEKRLKREFDPKCLEKPALV